MGESGAPAQYLAHRPPWIIVALTEMKSTERRHKHIQPFLALEKKVIKVYLKCPVYLSAHNSSFLGQGLKLTNSGLLRIWDHDLKTEKLVGSVLRVWLTTLADMWARDFSESVVKSVPSFCGYRIPLSCGRTPAGVKTKQYSFLLGGKLQQGRAQEVWFWHTLIKPK